MHIFGTDGWCGVVVFVIRHCTSSELDHQVPTFFQIPSIYENNLKFSEKLCVLKKMHVGRFRRRVSQLGILQFMLQEHLKKIERVHVGQLVAWETFFCQMVNDFCREVIHNQIASHLQHDAAEAGHHMGAPRS